ncbi:MAG: peptide MFS transporter, partial [bacterium]|nr:peptide MFS transporter [bacterium]
NVAGFEVPVSWFQTLNPLFIILLAPVFAWLWARLGSRDPSSQAKFVLGLIGASLGFAVLIGPAIRFEGGQLASPAWLVLTYLCHTCGELCLSPVGLSAMTKLAPARVGGFLMGVFFLSIAVGNYMGGRVASFYEAFSLPLLIGVVAAVALGAAVILAVFVKPMNRLTS